MGIMDVFAGLIVLGIILGIPLLIWGLYIEGRDGTKIGQMQRMNRTLKAIEKQGKRGS